MDSTTLITIFISLYLANLILDLVLSHLNRLEEKRHTKPPVVFEPYISLEQHQKSLAYHESYYWVEMLETLLKTAIFLAFVYTGLLNMLDQWLRGFITVDIHRGMAFYLILSGGSFLFNIPFELYATFGIEQKFGFNQQTWKLWIVDQIKSLLLSLVLTVPLGYAGLAFMQYSGEYWWLYCWAMLFAYSMFITMIYPIFIAPIFNKFTPLESGELRTKLEQLAAKANFSMANVYVMDASKRSTHSNAYFAGFGKTKRLVLYDSLLKDFTPDEVANIVAHEIGHHHHHHIIKQVLLSQVTSILFLYLLSITISHPYLYQTFLITSYTPADSTHYLYLGLFFVMIIVSLVLSFFAPAFNWLSWRFESQADAYGLQLAENREAMKTMFVKLADKNLANLTPHPLYARFHYSHPPIWQRLQDLGLVEGFVK